MTGMASKGRHIVITLSVLSVLSVWAFTLCPEHISYIICGRNTKTRVLMHLWVSDCLVPCRVPVILTSGLNNRKKHVLSITRILFDIGIPNGLWTHLGWRSVTYYFWVILNQTLTFGLNSRKIVSEVYLLYYCWLDPQLVRGYSLGPQSVTYCFLGTMTLTYGFLEKSCP